MTEKYTSTGTITLDDGADRTGIKIQAFDRDLPSRERRTGTVLHMLGEAISDADGNFEITYTFEQFQSGEGVPQFRRLRSKNADLSFRVFDRNEAELTIENIGALNQTLGPEQ